MFRLTGGSQISIIMCEWHFCKLSRVASQLKTSEENSSSEEDSSEDENSSEEKDSKEKLFPGGNEDKYDWKIMMFHQEYQIVQPLCEGILWGINDFIEEYKHLAELDFNNTCATH